MSRSSAPAAAPPVVRPTGLQAHRWFALLLGAAVLVGCGGGAVDAGDATVGTSAALPVAGAEASDAPPVVAAETGNPPAPLIAETSEPPPAADAGASDPQPGVLTGATEPSPGSTVGASDPAPATSVVAADSPPAAISEPSDPSLVVATDAPVPPPTATADAGDPPPAATVTADGSPPVAAADSSEPAPAAVAAESQVVGPGELRSAELLGTIQAYEIAAALAAGQTDVPPVVPLYAVRSYRLTYVTLDGRGREVVASGLVSVPLKGDGARSPVLSYQHGTIFFDAEAPTNNAVASEPPLIVASLGYIVVAADYVGYGASKGIPHPYLAAAPTAAAVLDLLTAAETWRRRSDVLDNGQLFLAGYSEGGYATMAAHRALQAGSRAMAARVLGSTPGAGPYHVGVTLDVLLDRVRDDNPVLGNLLSPGLLRYLGSSVRREVRKQLVDAMVPDDADVEFQTEFIDYYLADDDAALERCCNVHDWNPRTPVRMYHGRDDQTVPYAASLRTLQTMLSRGSSAASLSDCRAVPSSHLGCVPPYVEFLLGVLAADARDL